MRKILLFACLSTITYTSFAQSALYKKKPTLAVNFIMNDFKTAAAINRTTLSTVLKNDSWSKINEMAPGLSLSYWQGLSDHVDFMATLGGSFAEYNFKNEPATSAANRFLLEADANVSVKLLSDNYIATPFLSVGIGASSYSSHYGAFIPFGLGVQFKLSEESFLFTNFQYRLGITDHASNHLNYSLGFGAPLFSSK